MDEVASVADGARVFRAASQQTCLGGLKVAALETGSWHLLNVTGVRPIIVL